MLSLEQIAELAQPTPSKIVLLVMDGLGGLPHPETGKSELETAHKPNIDALARKSALGLIYPVAPGITPGSGPGHLALFGYDPVKYFIKRGIIEALGIGLEVRLGDIAVRGNFCTVDRSGKILDRRAGRISTEECTALCQQLDGVTMEGVRISVHPVKEHRLVAIFHGSGLSDDLSDSDPGAVGTPPREVAPLTKGAAKAARVANAFIAEARKRLAGRANANMVVVRGFSQLLSLPSMRQVFKLTPAAVAVYPMYHGLAKIVGMDVLPTGTTFEEEIDTVARSFGSYDFFFLHYKATDSAGEDGDFQRKVRAIEEADSLLPTVLALKPDVMILTGDHSSPAVLKGHSWHPVPLLFHSQYCPADGLTFSEKQCAQGSLGRFLAKELMPLALAHALKLAKYGA